MKIFQIDVTHENAHPFSSVTQTRCLFIHGNFIVVEYTRSHCRPDPSSWEYLIKNSVGETRNSADIYNYRRAISDWKKDQRIKALSEGYKVYEANMLYSDNAGKKYGIFTRRNIVDVALYSHELREKFIKFEKFLKDEYPMNKAMQEVLLKSASELAALNAIRFTDREIHNSVNNVCNSIKNHINGN